MHPGPPCSICKRKDIAKLNAALGENSTAKVGAMFKLPQSSVAKHKLKCITKKRPALEVPETAPLAAGASAQEQAAWHMARIETRMKAAEGANPPNEKEIAALYGQYTNAMKHHAKVSGASDVTEAQIVRSQPFVRAMAVINKALEAHPEAYRAVASAVSALVEGR